MTTYYLVEFGEDGRTHLPVEHVAALRALPNLQVFRPVDPTDETEAVVTGAAVELAEADAA